MYFGYDGLRKAWLDIYLKSPFSKDRLTGNTANQRKHCYNLNHSIVSIFSEYSAGK